jgi:Holliday junction DNA helicase RuvA
MTGNILKGRGAIKGVAEGVADVLNALIGLGYSEREALAATKAISPGTSVSEGIKQALKQLAR